MRPNKPLLRLASRIHQTLVRKVAQRPLPVLPDQFWENAQRWSRYLLMMHERGWHGAAAVAREELECALKSVFSQSETALSLLAARESSPPAVRMRDIYDELVALHQEFNEVDWNFKTGTLSVVTEPITLDETELGAFEVVLDWQNWDSSMPYKVVARQENPAECDNGVTHPHVHSEKLCEGDGRMPIRQALQQGRVCDFFLLVKQVLETYNPGSAFVKLQNWSGARCSDCGHDCEETLVCQGCESDICEECCCWCSACDGRRCSECRGRCHGCERTHCHDCLSACADCSEDFCEECLTDGCCSDCREAAVPAESSANAAQPDEGSETPSVAVHSAGLGQAVVSA